MQGCHTSGVPYHGGVGNGRPESCIHIIYIYITIQITLEHQPHPTTQLLLRGQIFLPLSAAVSGHHYSLESSSLVGFYLSHQRERGHSPQ